MGVFDRYKAGEFVSGYDWTEDIENAWVVEEEVRSNRAVVQIGLDGDHYYRKLNPVVELSPEQENLLRVDDKPKGGILPLVLNYQQQELLDNHKLGEVRAELASFIDGARGLEGDPQSLNAGGNF